MPKDFNKIQNTEGYSESETGWEYNGNKTIEQMIDGLNLDKKLAEMPMLVERLRDVRDKDTGDFNARIRVSDDGREINVQNYDFREGALNKDGNMSETEFKIDTRFHLQDNGTVYFNKATEYQSRYGQGKYNVMTKKCDILKPEYGKKYKETSSGLIDESGKVVEREDVYSDGRGERSMTVRASRNENNVSFDLATLEGGELIHHDTKTLSTEQYDSIFTKRRANELGYDAGFITDIKWKYYMKK